MMTKSIANGLCASIEEWIAEGRRGDCIVRRTTPDAVRVLLADATGHDSRSARVMDFLRPMLERDMGAAVNQRVFRHWSDAVYSRFADEGLFACFTVIELERSMQLLKIANAGNPELLIRRADNRVDRFASTGMPLGIVGRSDWIPPTLHYTRLRPGDCAVCFSDGLVDRIGRNGDRFGLERVCRAARYGERRMMRTLRTHVQRFSCEYADQDDLSVVLVCGRQPID